MSTANTTAIVAIPHGETTAIESFMPIMSIEQAVGRHNAVIQFAKTVMREGLDYGTIPGTERKSRDGTPSSKNNTLLKPGAEKLCTLFGLVPDFQDYRVTEDWDKGFFYYAFRCVLSRNGKQVASGIGSCNSREKKYRRVQRCCPGCGASTLKKSKYPPRGSKQGTPGGWWCDSKNGGCGTDFQHDDPAITSQTGTIDPAETADLVNTIQKMAQKRALVAATLVATGASEFFTQDVEDMGIIEGDWEPHTPPVQQEEQHDAAEPVVMASEQEVIQLEELISSLDDPKATTAGILKSAKVKSLGQLTAEQAAYFAGRCRQSIEKKKNAASAA